MHHLLATSLTALTTTLLPVGPDDPAKPVPEVVLRAEPVTTVHSIELDGQAVEYEAIAGTLPLFDEKDGSVEAEIFHIAYLRRDVDPGTRPLIFLFNGGPGSSSVWLHMGAFGPVRVLTGDAGSLRPPPWSTAPNEGCLLDVADMVFIDPVSTGFSRMAEGGAHEDFHGLEQDAESVARFIRLFITRHDRWQSPKYIGGESYGTVRSAALVEKLQDGQGIYLNGVLLVSSILDFGTVRTSGGNDLPYCLFLPTYAATAWEHGLLDRGRFPDLPSAVAAAESYAIERYLPRLAMGTSLDPTLRQQTVEELAGLTGLDRDLIDRADLRVGPSRFRKELLADRGEVVGRFDSRFLGPVMDPMTTRPEYDPSYTAIVGPYTSTLNHYVRTVLGYRSDLPYEILTGKVWPWDYSGFENRYVAVADRLKRSMVKNPSLGVFIASGYFDLATPHFATDYVVDHMELSRDFLDHLEVEYYPAGHMMYLNDALRVKLSKDVRSWIEKTRNTVP